MEDDDDDDEEDDDDDDRELFELEDDDLEDDDDDDDDEEDDDDDDDRFAVLNRFLLNFSLSLDFDDFWPFAFSVGTVFEAPVVSLLMHFLGFSWDRSEEEEEEEEGEE